MPFVDGRPGLSGLRQAHIKLFQSAGRGYTSRKLRPFYQLPSMKVLKAQMVIGGFVRADQLPEKSSPIEHLEIVQSCMPSGCHDLIAPCKHLKSFKYSHHDSSRLDIDAFSQSLGARKDTLEELSVDHFWGVSSGTIDNQSFGLLSDYAALKRLRLSMDILVGDRLRTPLVDILPPCLESLYIADMGRDEGKHKVLVAELCNLVKASHVRASSWASTGGTIVAALQNGGPMAVLYGLILVSVFYTLVSASLSELASSMPSAGGVYYWSSVLSQKHGRIVGFFTGYLNACAWLLSTSSISSMMGNEIVAMHMLRSPGMKWQPWQVFIVFQLVNWICCGIVCLGNRFIPLINRIALLLSMCGLLVTVIILAVMPAKHASSSEVWTNFHNKGRWPDGVSFMTGLLNAAFAVGVPDCISHLSEEVPNPEIKVPQGIMLQMLTAFTTAFIYLIALFYSIQDLDAVFNSEIAVFPTAEIYKQATGSSAGAIGLIAVLFLATFPTLIGTLVTGGRMWWSLARDNATPFASYFSKVHPKLNTPVRATVAEEYRSWSFLFGATWVCWLMAMTAVWWFFRGRRDYRGPQYSKDAALRLMGESDRPVEGKT
ncbi:amino acid permease-domain-containing protein [Aspergillus sergii]|uniref:Amino acid permease-domain-containing protein n=1 Tax=Aspergillus sergii TaxID=1034303 RepID=A0A5N6WL02_9EURO|nr:amino acid permease-domain-containing protein [Aspergillus sergii]